MNENEKRFSDSETTPAMQAPLLKHLGYSTDGPAVEAILNGTFRCPQADKYSQLILAELAMPQAIRNLGPTSVHITVDEHATA